MAPECGSIIIRGNGGRPLEKQAGKSHLQPQTQNPDELEVRRGYKLSTPARRDYFLQKGSAQSPEGSTSSLNGTPKLLTKCSDT